MTPSADQRTIADQMMDALSRRRPSPDYSGLPVADLPSRSRDHSVCYSLSRVDTRGRLADRSLPRLLDWEPAQRLAVSSLDDSVVVERCPTGTAAITRQGHLRLPIAARYGLALQAGGQLLTAAYPAYAVLVLYPLRVVDAMLVDYHSAPCAGSRP